LRPSAIEPDGLAPEESCRTLAYIATTRAPSRGKVAKELKVFNPRECARVTTGGGDSLVDTVTLNEGVKVFLKQTADLLFGPVETVQLQPLRCDEPEE
jgi:hypothetical protein